MRTNRLRTLFRGQAALLSMTVSQALVACGGSDAPTYDAGQGHVIDVDGSLQPSQGDGGGLDDGAGITRQDDAAACARADVTVSRVPPTVWLLVDRVLANVSIGDAQGQPRSIYTSMWHDMMGPEGTVTQLQSGVRFGFMLTGSNDFLKPACPGQIAVDPALNNRDAIAASYPESVEGGGLSLTYYSLDALLARAEAISDPAARRSLAAVVFIPQAGESLCIDEQLRFGTTEDVPIAQNDRLVRELAELGVRTFVVGSNVDCDGCYLTRLDRLERMAMLGATGRGPFLVGQAGELTEALGEITSTLVDCQVALQGAVKEGAECQGDVRIDGKAVPCGDANGWKLNGPSGIEFVGAACTELRQKPTAKITASFPCDVVVLL